MVKKSGDALDHVVLKLVDHLEQETAEDMRDDDPARNPWILLRMRTRTCRRRGWRRCRRS